MDFDVEDFKNGKFNELKALTDALVKLDTGSEVNEHWSICFVLRDRIKEVDDFLGQVAYGDETKDETKKEIAYWLEKVKGWQAALKADHAS